MFTNVDWKGVLEEIRLFAKEIQSDRFYALYLLVLILVVAYVWKR